MNNWKNIHPEFTEELQKEWEERGFNYQECKEWTTTGLDINEVEFAYFLQNQGHTPEECLNEGNLEKLKEIYKQRKGKGVKKALHPFEIWREKGFTDQEIQEWIDLGLGLDEVNFVVYLKNKGYNYAWSLPKDILPHLREEYEQFWDYQEKIIQAVSILWEKAQEWQKAQIEQRNNFSSFQGR